MGRFDFYIFAQCLLFALFIAADVHFCLLDITSKDVPEFLKFIGSHVYLFMTNWNYSAQHLFLLHGISDALISNFFDECACELRKKLNSIRNFLFTTVIYPSTIFVMAMFWSLFFYDREIIYPRYIDDFVPFYLNICVHALVIFPVLLELIYKDVVLLKPILIYSTTMFYNFVYFCLGITWYFVQGRWVYIVFEVSDWPVRIIIFLSFFGINATALAVLYFFKNKTNRLNARTLPL